MKLLLSKRERQPIAVIFKKGLFPGHGALGPRRQERRRAARLPTFQTATPPATAAANNPATMTVELTAINGQSCQ